MAKGLVKSLRGSCCSMVRYIISLLLGTSIHLTPLLKASGGQLSGLLCREAAIGSHSGHMIESLIYMQQLGAKAHISYCHIYAICSREEVSLQYVNIMCIITSFPGISFLSISTFQAKIGQDNMKSVQLFNKLHFEEVRASAYLHSSDSKRMCSTVIINRATPVYVGLLFPKCVNLSV